jgi:cytochrome P450
VLQRLGRSELDQQSHYPALALKRNRGIDKVGNFAGQDHYFTYRYEDVSRVLADDSTFSSEVIASRYGVVLGKNALVGLTGLEHTSKRRLIANELSRAAVSRLHTTTIDEVVKAAFAPGDWGIPQDLIRLSATIPANIISGILGLDDDRLEDVQKWTTAIFYFAEHPREGVRAARSLRQVLRDVIAKRRSCPRDDLISKLIELENQEHGVRDNEILSTVLLLLTAGIETTRCAIGNLLWTLLTNADALDSFLHDPSTVASGIEESLRWESPAQFTARVARKDVRFADVLVASNSVIFAHIGSANHDPSVFSDPEEFSASRHAAQHLAFGLGTHRCPGRYLARAELARVVSELATVLPEMRIRPKTETPSIWGELFRQVDTLDITVHHTSEKNYSGG